MCIANTSFRKADKKKLTNGSGCNVSEIDLCIMGKGDQQFSENVSGHRGVEA